MSEPKQRPGANGWATAIATWFGCGEVPKGPGTAGAAGGMLVAAVAWRIYPYAPYWLLAATVATLPLFIWACSNYAEARGLKDPQKVVVDEVAGTWLTLAGATHLESWLPWLLGFGLFRLFDIVKPPPVRQMERFASGTGIMADDLMAGVYGALVLRLLGIWQLY